MLRCSHAAEGLHAAFCITSHVGAENGVGGAHGLIRQLSLIYALFASTRLAFVPIKSF